MAAPPGRTSSRQPTTSTSLPNILQRFVKANQDLARHNAKVRARTLASGGETQLCLTPPSLAAPTRPPLDTSQGGSRRQRRSAGTHRHRAIPQAERGGVAREARAPGAPAPPTDAPPSRFPPSRTSRSAHDAFPHPQTRLRAANDEIVKLKIHIDAQTSLRDLQRTLDAPVDPSSRPIPTPPSAASVVVGSPRPECSTSPASPVQLSTPTDAHFPSPDSWSLRAPSAMVKRQAWEFLGSSPEASARVSTPSPPESFLPSPRVRWDSRRRDV